MKKTLRTMEYAILAYNVLVVLAICVFIYLTTNKIYREYEAAEFLEKVEAIPASPKRLLFTIALLLLYLVISFMMRENMKGRAASYKYISLAIDFLISILIVYLLGFNYNGILLWVFANFIAYIKDVNAKYWIIGLAIVSYIGTDYGIAAFNRHVFSISSYIGYYATPVQRYLQGIYTAFTSINIILFLLFCVYTILMHLGTLNEVETLNKKLAVVNQDLQEANIELIEYANIKEKMGETKERNRLAREIHDTLGHTLTGISAGIDASIATIDVAPTETKKQLEMISQVTREGINEVRRSVNELRPDALERLSLDKAIHKMIAKFSVTDTKIIFRSHVPNLKFDSDEEDTIYRVVQESITNSIRHGNAKNIVIEMKEEAFALHIFIVDDGNGAKEIKPGFGTRHIRERVERLKGSVSFDGSNGFKTQVIIPIRWGKTYD